MTDGQAGIFPWSWDTRSFLRRAHLVGHVTDISSSPCVRPPSLCPRPRPRPRPRAVQVLGLLGPAVALVLAKDMSPFWTLSPMLVWFAIFFPQAHKEERFLFPVYPVICLSGAYALVTIDDLVRHLKHRF